MYLSDREQVIVKHLLLHSQGITLNQLQEVLGVSRRTVYRELSSLSQTLVRADMAIVHVPTYGYQLKASLKQKEKLKQLVCKINKCHYAREERQALIACRLLILKVSLTTIEWATIFDVSQSTIQNDLREIHKLLKIHGLTLSIDSNYCYQIQGDEIVRRQVAVALLDQWIDEYHFFMALKQVACSKHNAFLEFINKDVILLVGQVFDEVAKEEFYQVTDNQRKLIMLDLMVSLMRIKEGYVLKKGPIIDKVKQEELVISQKIMIWIVNKWKLSIPLHEHHLLAKQLDGINYKPLKQLLIERYDSHLLYQVSQFIAEVTNWIGNDFAQDEELYYNLVTHIQATLNRSNNKSLSVTTDSLLDRVANQYETLFRAVTKNFSKVFDGVQLSRDEAAYIVIHFATSYEKHPVSLRTVRLLLVCTSGIGTARILEHRLIKVLPHNTKMKVINLSEFTEKIVDLYDLIISTIHLPHLEGKYYFVSPFLLDKEMVAIVDKVIEISDESPRKKEVQIEYCSKNNTIEKFYRNTQICYQFYNEFQITQLWDNSTLTDSIHKMMKHLPKDLVRHKKIIEQKLLESFNKSPIGIPGTGLALCHARHKDVSRPFFSIFDLNRVVTIRAMDNQMMVAKRMLLLLAPEELSEELQRLMGNISTSIIENEYNRSIYNQGSKQAIKSLLNTILMKWLANVVNKERIV